MSYTIGLDLGQSADYTAYAIVSHLTNQYHVEKLGRWRGISYTEIVDKMASICRSPKLYGNKLVIDFTGVGRPVYDMFVQARLPSPPIGISITGGREITGSGNIKNVPKETLMAFTKVMFQNKNIVIHKGPFRDILKQELSNIEYKQSDATGHTSYGAWRSGTHDDLVLAVSLASWYSSLNQSQNVNWYAIRGAPCKSGLEGAYAHLTGGIDPDDPYGILSDDY